MADIEARRIISCVVMARQPMSLDELTDAMGVNLTSMSYSSKRVPNRALVKSLCYPLIEMDDRNDPRNPILGVFHNSVAEFLKQDPKLLDIPEACQKFFVNSAMANLDIGRTCMIYLSQEVYTKPQDVDSVACKTCDRRDFLLYAAFFWHLHLSEAPKSAELFDEVRRFMQSRNFWTCMQVQGICAPYHFAPLRQVESGGFVMSLKAAKIGEIYYPNPLPRWLDAVGEDGELLVKLYHSFVKEWSTVLSNYPESIRQCQPWISGEIQFPCPDSSTDVDNGVRLLLPDWSFSLANGTSHEPVKIHLTHSDNAVVAVMNSFAAGKGVLRVLQARADITRGKIDVIQSATPTSDFTLSFPGCLVSTEEGNASMDRTVDEIPAAIKGNMSILRNLSSTRQMSSWLSNFASSMEQRLTSKNPDCIVIQTEEESVQNGPIIAVSQRYVVIPVCEDSNSETSDLSDEEDDQPSLWPKQNSVENILAVFIKDDMKIFTHSIQSGRLQRSEPKIHPSGSWVIWALDESEVLLWNLENGEQVIQKLAPTGQDLQNDMRFIHGMLRILERLASRVDASLDERQHC